MYLQHSDPFELIDWAVIIIIILLWLCIKHHWTTCTSGGSQRSCWWQCGGEESHQHSPIQGSSADIYTSLSSQTLAAETGHWEEWWGIQQKQQNVTAYCWTVELWWSTCIKLVTPVYPPLSHDPRRLWPPLSSVRTWGWHRPHQMSLSVLSTPHKSQ